MEFLNILARNTAQAEISIVACIIGMVFFMKYDQKQKDSTGHKWIGIGLTVALLSLVAYRIYIGVK